MLTCSETSKVLTESPEPSVASSSIPASLSSDSPLTFSNDEEKASGPFSRKKRKRTEGWMRSDSDEDIPVANELSPEMDSLPRTLHHEIPANGEKDALFSPLQDFECLPDTMTEMQLEHGQFLRESIFGRQLAKEREIKRLMDILKGLTRMSASREECDALLQSKVVASKFSYSQIDAYLKSRCGVRSHSVRMCPDGHMAATGPFENTVNCQSEGCLQLLSSSNRFWYVKISEQLAAMCMEQDSFDEINEGFKRACRAALEPQSEILSDFTDGTYFRHSFNDLLQAADHEKEIIVFLSLSTDGFEVFSGSEGEHTCWPVIFSVLNLGTEHRYRASNSVLSAFAPGTHDGIYFDTFLLPLVEDLIELQQGINITCIDGRIRRLQAFLFVVTADWPASSKVSGFCGHGSKHPCRCCHKSAVNRALVPTGSTALRKRAASGEEGFWDWIEKECPDVRTNRQTERVWDQLYSLNGGSSMFSGDSSVAVSRRSGVKRRPVISTLYMDFCNAFPYDPMHLCLQGWVRHLVTRLCGFHVKTVSLKSPFVLSAEVQRRIDATLETALTGIPAAWGRVPPRLDRLSSYKAESFKSLALHFCPFLFSGPGVDKKVTLLWTVTRDILEIVFDPTPRRSDIKILRRLVQQAHALFTEVFFPNNKHAFSFTPTTHAMLHLADALEACGPLLNVSQFLPERVIGEVGRHAHSKVRPEANLFHKSQTLFALRMVGGGLRDAAARNDRTDGSELVVDVHSCSLPGQRAVDETFVAASRGHETAFGWTLQGGTVRNAATFSWKQEVTEVILRESMLSYQTVSITSLTHYSRAKCESDGLCYTVETVSAFRARERNQSRAGSRSRQKCWIAAEYIPEEEHSRAESETGEIVCLETYYGCIMDLFCVQYDARTVEGKAQQLLSIQLARIEWQQGLTLDKQTGTVYTRLHGARKGSVKDLSRTFEVLSCIKRNIGFCDHAGRRYFLDCKRREILEGSQRCIKGVSNA